MTDEQKQFGKASRESSPEKIPVGSGVPSDEGADDTEDERLPLNGRAFQRVFAPEFQDPEKSRDDTGKDVEAQYPPTTDASKWTEEPCVAHQLTDENYANTYRPKRLYCKLYNLEDPQHLADYEELQNACIGASATCRLASTPRFSEKEFKVFVQYIKYEFYQFKPKSNNGK